MSLSPDLDHEVIIIGAGVTGIYQLKRMLDQGIDAVVLESSPDLGGTWYNNRYPGARFDSESVSYGYSFSEEVLQEWHWKERFSPQPENLRYLNFVAAKFDLRKYMTFGFSVESAVYSKDGNFWTVRGRDGKQLKCRFLILALGLLSVPTAPKLKGIDSFKGRQFHTYSWPHDGVDLAGKKVGVVGTGATGIQVISAIADQVAELYVFQRRPNWSAPLGNAPISESEMKELRAQYPAIFEKCAASPGGFVHSPPEAGFYDVPAEERRAFWDKLYDAPGFGLWMGNYRETLTDEAANAELSEYVAARIRQRVASPAVADKLIPKDHGFGVQRLPLETRYFEIYNRSNVHLIDLSETPIARVTEHGIETNAQSYGLDIIVYATGFDAITGAFDKIHIQGESGATLKDRWAQGPSSFFGMLVHGFPNLLMATGPQGASASANYPRAIEVSVDWCSNLIAFVRRNHIEKFDAKADAETKWFEHVKQMYSAVLMRKAKSWFTGYNSNIEGRGEGEIRYMVYNGGAQRLLKKINAEASASYPNLEFLFATDTQRPTSFENAN